jgi:hypothetical protein
MSLFALIAVVLLSGPIPAVPKLLHCSAFCQQLDGYRQCWYEEKYRCGFREFACVDSEDQQCTPRFVNLGSWNPIPDGYHPEDSSLYRHLTTNVPESYIMQSNVALPTGRSY